MTTFLICAAVLIVVWFYFKNAQQGQAWEDGKGPSKVRAYQQRLKKIASGNPRSSLEQALKGIQLYCNESKVFFEKANALGMGASQTREFVLQEMEKKRIQGAFIVDIPVEIYVETYLDTSEFWNFSSSNKEFNRIHQYIREELSDLLCLGCDLNEKERAGGSLRLHLSTDLPYDSPSSFANTSRTGKVHADVHAASEELKTYAQYKTLTTKTIPFAIFVFGKDHDGDEYVHALTDDTSEGEEKESDYCRLFLMTVPLTLMNPMYRHATQYVDSVEKNLQFKG
jgi:hypothetical protein